MDRFFETCVKTWRDWEGACKGPKWLTCGKPSPQEGGGVKKKISERFIAICGCVKCVMPQHSIGDSKFVQEKMFSLNFGPNKSLDGDNPHTLFAFLCSECKAGWRVVQDLSSPNTKISNPNDTPQNSHISWHLTEFRFELGLYFFQFPKRTMDRSKSFDQIF